MALQEIDESLLAASKAKFLAKYDQNYDGRISLEEVRVPRCMFRCMYTQIRCCITKKIN